MPGRFRSVRRGRIQAVPTGRRHFPGARSDSPLSVPLRHFRERARRQGAFLSSVSRASLVVFGDQIACSGAWIGGRSSMTRACPAAAGPGAGGDDSDVVGADDGRDRRDSLDRVACVARFESGPAAMLEQKVGVGGLAGMPPHHDALVRQVRQVRQVAVGETVLGGDGDGQPMLADGRPGQPPGRPHAAAQASEGRPPTARVRVAYCKMCRQGVGEMLRCDSRKGSGAKCFARSRCFRW